MGAPKGERDLCSGLAPVVISVVLVFRCSIIISCVSRSKRERPDWLILWKLAHQSEDSVFFLKKGFKMNL